MWDSCALATPEVFNMQSLSSQVAFFVNTSKSTSARLIAIQPNNYFEASLWDPSNTHTLKSHSQSFSITEVCGPSQEERGSGRMPKMCTVLVQDSQNLIVPTSLQMRLYPVLVRQPESDCPYKHAIVVAYIAGGPSWLSTPRRQT